MRALSLGLILAGLAIVAVVFTLYPELDLRIAVLFYDPAKLTWPLADNPVIVSLRNLNSAIDIVIGIVLAFALIVAWRYPTQPHLVSRRAVIFLVVTFVLVPGLIANGIFKEHWSRPRPSHITQFGGPAQFVAWWDPRGTCQRNCSFFSGEVSSAAWTIAPALLVPGVAGVVAIVAAFAFTIAIAVVRMAQGGHFVSDAAFGALLTWLTIWIAVNLRYFRQ
ncbi:MAG: phosphatase PAP2 family protein [Xanthobacteraceae bacterium]